MMIKDVKENMENSGKLIKKEFHTVSFQGFIKFPASPLPP
jgi:hypothetical protein